MDRRLVQVKQCRSNPAIADFIVRCLAKSTARSVMCRGMSRRLSGCVRTWRVGTTNPTPDTSDAYRSPEEVRSWRVEAAPIRSPAR